jgi:YbbR domain-containing protein
MRRFFVRVFFRNWGLKLFSLLLAIILWLTLMLEVKVFSDKRLTVPLELHNIPPEMELVEKPLSLVDVVIKAPRRLLNQINSATVHVVLNLEKARLDQTEYPLNKNMISIPEGAEVKDIYPSQVELRLERSREIMMPIEANITGKLQEGFKIEKVEIIPPQVPIRGPESKVNEKDKVRTSPIDISSLTESTEIEADLILPKPDLKLASSVTRVRVRILIQQEQTEEEKKEEKDKNSSSP